MYSPMHPHAQPSVPELRSRAEPGERKPPKPLAVGVNEAAKILGISPWTTRCYVTQGALRAVHVGRRVLVPMEVLGKVVLEGVKRNNS